MWMHLESLCLKSNPDYVSAAFGRKPHIFCCSVAQGWRFSVDGIVHVLTAQLSWWIEWKEAAAGTMHFEGEPVCARPN